jgi:thymidylate synthase
LGEYGRRFGAPAFKVKVIAEKVAAIEVLRGAPCGATWAAADKMIGRPTVGVATRMGLEVQFFCSADPAGWDPLFGRSPVHFAGKIHRAALDSALGASRI